jgi:hypothetical protein
VCPGFESLIRHHSNRQRAPADRKNLPENLDLAIRRIVRGACLMLCLIGAVQARDFPASAKTGELKSTDYPFVKIDDKQMRLAPGARVFDLNNRIILPTLLPAGVKILYETESSGLVLTIWLLTAEEAARPIQRRPQ